METAKDKFSGLKITDKAVEFVKHIESGLDEQYANINNISLVNQAKVLAAFKKNRVEGRHFSGTTGYGYGDIGRDTLDAVFADTFHTEAALVRPQIVSGTHALSLCLYALCNRGTHLISITGKPYDTLLETIGLSKSEDYSIDSLLDIGVQYDSVELTAGGKIDIKKACDMLIKDSSNKTIVYLQRSRGYDWRPSISIDEIKSTILEIKCLRSDVNIIVDNCYGEFVEEYEPSDAGADLIIGSLIKNPGGGLAPTGAYFAGRKKLTDRIQYRLTAPGIGAEVGSWPYG